MDYFKILHLTREPFSNSPDPEIFYPSKQHQECLHRLEISIRLKRGLNVVLGDVGTGKTTLCRKLVQSLGNDQKISTHLILDPKFSSPKELLLELCQMMKADNCTSIADSESALKEEIKNHLFSQVIDKNQTIVLLIDEAQKIPSDCLEILRELLNYESNQYKLLQIVLFAQQEFSQILKQHPNIADRISFHFTLSSMSFSDTRKFINYRLQQSLEPGYPPIKFSKLAQLFVYFYSSGYPRKIVNLCHHTILGLIIQNKTRITWRMVRFSAKNSGLKPFKYKKKLYATLFILFIFFLGYFLFPSSLLKQQINSQNTFNEHKVSSLQGNNLPLFKDKEIKNPERYFQSSSHSKNESSQVASVTSSANKSFKDKNKQPVHKNTHPPESLGRISIKDGDSLWSMAQRIYGIKKSKILNRYILPKLIESNKQLSNPDQISPGVMIKFPVLDFLQNKPNTGYKIVFDQKEKLSEIYPYLQNQYKQTEVNLLSLWSPNRGLQFFTALPDDFSTLSNAQKVKSSLAVKLRQQARIINLKKDNAKDIIVFTGYSQKK